MAVEAESGASGPAPGDVALAVDLDGTLTPTDTLHEGLVALLKAHPFAMLQLPAWLGAGKAHFKREVARRAPLDASLLPYNETVLERVREARSAGRRTVLASASDQQIVSSEATVFSG